MQEISVQWFPGHMAKTRRLMQSNLKLVDVVVELCDARIPMSSRNPEMDKLTQGKPRVILLNKCDAASDAATKRWIAHYAEQGIPAIATDCRSGKGLNAFLPLVRESIKEKIERWQGKGMVGRPIRIMIVGIPNVGKSSLINRLAGSKRAKVEDRPGVTRGKQWVTLDKGIELLDMPGVLWPKFEDKAVGEKLAFTGAVKDDILDVEYLAVRLLEVLRQTSSQLLTARYKLKPEDFEGDSFALLSAVGRRRGMLISGGEIDTHRAAIMLMDEFRGGVIGRITLELPGKKPTAEV